MTGVVLAVFIVASLVSLALTGFWAWSLVDLLRRPADQWQGTEENKRLWLALVIVLGFVGSILYLLIPGPALRRYEAAARMPFDPTAFGVPDGGVQYGESGFGPPIHEPDLQAS